MDIIEALNVLGKRINRWYPNINSGGCCVYAAMVAEELHKRGVDVCIIVAAECSDDDEGHNADLNYLERNIKSNSKADWNNNGVFFNHVGIEFRIGDDIYHYDSNGVHPEDVMLDCWRLYEGRISIETAKSLAEEAEGWNTTFNRKSIPSLRLHVSNFFKNAFPVKT